MARMTSSLFSQQQLLKYSQFRLQAAAAASRAPWRGDGQGGPLQPEAALFAHSTSAARLPPAQFVPRPCGSLGALPV